MLRIHSCRLVRDLSHTAVTISPADYSSWHDARTELMSEAKAGLKARVEAELAAAAGDEDIKALRDKFAAEERAIEHQIDHQVHTFSTSLDVTYNVRARRPHRPPRPRRALPSARSSSPSRAPTTARDDDARVA